jgi:hypothetical protein
MLKTKLKFNGKYGAVITNKSKLREIKYIIFE